MGIALDTYSVSVTGLEVGPNELQPVRATVASVNVPTGGVLVGDSVVQSPAGEQQAMQLGTPFYCKGPDGIVSLHVFDAERSIPGVLRVVRKI